MPRSGARSLTAAEAAWPAGAAALSVAFAGFWAVDPVRRSSAGQAVVEQLGLLVLFVGPVAAAVVAISGSRRLRSSAVAVWAGAAVLFVWLLGWGWAVAFWSGDLQCPVTTSCSTDAAARMVGWVGVTALWLVTWWAWRRRTATAPAA